MRLHITAQRFSGPIRPTVRYLGWMQFDYKLRYSRVRSVSALLPSATSRRDDYYLVLPERSGG